MKENEKTIEQKSEVPKIRFPVIETVFLGLAVLAFLLMWFQWEAAERLPLVLMMPYYLLVGLIVLVMAVISLAMLPANRTGKSLPRRLILLAITAITALIIWGIPISRIYLQWAFQSKYQARNEVVQLIESGDIGFDGKTQGRVTLPAEYARLSRAGEILIDLEGDNPRILFIEYNGEDETCWGFLYFSGGSEDEAGNASFADNIVGLQKREDNWYWIALS